MVASPTTSTARYPMPTDGPLMARLRIPDALRMPLGGGSEDSDQRALARLLDSMGLLWQHTPNEGSRSATERGAALSRGLKRGTPDILIFDPFALECGAYSGLAIELKRSDATPCAVGDDQRLWLSRLRDCGWMAEWCRGFAEASRLIRAAYGQRATGRG